MRRSQRAATAKRECSTEPARASKMAKYDDDSLSDTSLSSAGEENVSEYGESEAHASSESDADSVVLEVSSASPATEPEWEQKPTRGRAPATAAAPQESDSDEPLSHMPRKRGLQKSLKTRVRLARHADQPV